MELNAEQIKKALECCLSGDDCTICPLCDEQSCPCVLNENALALINSQEQRIKELAEEAVSWKSIAEGYQKQFEDCAEDRAKLTEDNERLKAENARYEAENHAQFDKWLKLEEATKRHHSELFEEAKIITTATAPLTVLTSTPGGKHVGT